MFIVDYSVPPPADAPVPSSVKWPWKDMAVGGSVAIPRDMIAKARNAVRAYASRHPEKSFVERRELPSGILRIWRVS